MSIGFFSPRIPFSIQTLCSCEQAELAPLWLDGIQLHLHPALLSLPPLFLQPVCPCFSPLTIWLPKLRILFCRNIKLIKCVFLKWQPTSMWILTHSVWPTVLLFCPQVWLASAILVPCARVWGLVNKLWGKFLNSQKQQTQLHLELMFNRVLITFNFGDSYKQICLCPSGNTRTLCFKL